MDITNDVAGYAILERKCNKGLLLNEDLIRMKSDLPHISVIVSTCGGEVGQYGLTFVGEFCLP